MIRDFVRNSRNRSSSDALDRHGTTRFRSRNWHICRHSAVRVSGRLQERRSDSCRNVDRDETVSGEEVILAALVDNTDIATLLRVPVGQDDVDFVALERDFVAAVVDANRKVSTGGGGLVWSSRGTSCA